MKLTWKEFFPLVGEMLELKQKEIAAHLDVNSSTISRLAAGKVKRPTCMKRENLYKNLFDTTNDKSPVYNKNEKDLLETFIAIIREKNYEEAIKDLNTDSYKPFILGMLRLIRENQPPRVKSSGEKEDSLFRDIRVKDTTQSVVVSDQTHETFEQTNCDPSTPQNDPDYSKFSVDVPRIIKESAKNSSNTSEENMKILSIIPSKKTELSRKILDIFTREICDYGIVKLLVYGNLEKSTNIDDFIESLRLEIQPYIENILGILETEEGVFFKRLEDFIDRLEGLSACIPMIRSSVNTIKDLKDIKEEKLSEYENSVLCYYKESVKFLAVICHDNDLSLKDIVQKKDNQFSAYLPYDYTYTSPHFQDAFIKVFKECMQE